MVFATRKAKPAVFIGGTPGAIGGLLSRKKAMQQYYEAIQLDAVDIYGLATDLNPLINYIGSTRDMRSRLLDHVNKNENPELFEWVQEVHARGEKVIAIPLETNVPSKVRLQREQYWIDMGHKLGLPLKNRLRAVGK